MGLFIKPTDSNGLINGELNEMAYKYLLLRYKHAPTADLSRQIIKYCTEEKWRITILEIDENFCIESGGCKKSKIRENSDTHSSLKYFHTNKNVCECQKRSFRNVGRVIGKNGTNLKEIERKTGTIIFFNKLKKCFVLRTLSHQKNKSNARVDHGDIFQAVSLILDGLKIEQKEYSDWEKYYYWWYYFNQTEQTANHRKYIQ